MEKSQDRNTASNLDLSRRTIPELIELAHEVIHEIEDRIMEIAI